MTACATARPRIGDRRGLRGDLRYTPTEHRYVYANTAVVTEVNIGGVTLDLAKFAMAARGVTLSRTVRSPVAACTVVLLTPQHRQKAHRDLGRIPTGHRRIWTDVAAALTESIGGVTLDLANFLAKLAKLAMAARVVTLSCPTQSPVAAGTVARRGVRHQRKAHASLRPTPTQYRRVWTSIAAARGTNIGGVTLDVANMARSDQV